MIRIIVYLGLYWVLLCWETHAFEVQVRPFGLDTHILGILGLRACCNWECSKVLGKRRRFLVGYYGGY